MGGPYLDPDLPLSYTGRVDPPPGQFNPLSIKMGARFCAHTLYTALFNNNKNNNTVFAPHPSSDPVEIIKWLICPADSWCMQLVHFALMHWRILDLTPPLPVQNKLDQITCKI